MNKGLFARIFVCILCLGFCLYSYLNLQNEITELRIKIPSLTSEVRRIQEENTRYRYEIERFEDPQNLMQLAKRSEFAHLRFPITSEVLTLQQAENILQEKDVIQPTKKPKITFASGGRP